MRPPALFLARALANQPSGHPQRKRLTLRRPPAQALHAKTTLSEILDYFKEYDFKSLLTAQEQDVQVDNDGDGMHYFKPVLTILQEMASHKIGLAASTPADMLKEWLVAFVKFRDDPAIEEAAQSGTVDEATMQKIFEACYDKYADAVVTGAKAAHNLASQHLASAVSEQQDLHKRAEDKTAEIEKERAQLERKLSTMKYWEAEMEKVQQKRTTAQQEYLVQAGKIDDLRRGADLLAAYLKQSNIDIYASQQGEFSKLIVHMQHCNLHKLIEDAYETAKVDGWQREHLEITEGDRVRKAQQLMANEEARSRIARQLLAKDDELKTTRTNMSHQLTATTASLSSAMARAEAMKDSKEVQEGLNMDSFAKLLEKDQENKELKEKLKVLQAALDASQQ